MCMRTSCVTDESPGTLSPDKREISLFTVMALGRLGGGGHLYLDSRDKAYHSIEHVYRGRSRGGGSWGSGPPTFSETPKLNKEGKKMLSACVQIHSILVTAFYYLIVTQNLLSEILYPPLVF